MEIEMPLLLFECYVPFVEFRGEDNVSLKEYYCDQGILLSHSNTVLFFVWSERKGTVVINDIVQYYNPCMQCLATENIRLLEYKRIL